MTDTSPDGGRRSPQRTAAVAAVILLVVGAVALTLGLRGHDGPPQPTAADSQSTSTPTSTPSTTATPATPSATATSTATAAAKPSSTATQISSTFLSASAPKSIEVASVGIRSTNFVDLDVAKDGTITVPGSANEVGIYAGGPSPGQLGPAVIGAHVDSTKGPGVFYRLGGTKVGDTIKIGRADGKTAVFTVDRVSVFPKDKFPTALVYGGDFSTSQIRLVTCGGVFDKVKHYLDNVVVFGHLTSVA